MKTLLWASALVMILASSCGSSSELAAQSESIAGKTEESAGMQSPGDPTGTWEITTSTPRGKRNATLRIVEEEGGLIGYGERGNVPIKQEGNVLTWSATFDSPRGAIDVQNTAELSGDTMEGAVEMLSGPMSGRSFTFSGTRNRSDN